MIDAIFKKSQSPLFTGTLTLTIINEYIHQKNYHYLNLIVTYIKIIKRIVLHINMLYPLVRDKEKVVKTWLI